MKKILFGLAFLVMLATVGLFIWGLTKDTPATCLEETMAYMFYGEDSEAVKEAYGFEVSSEEVYTEINPDATETQIELYEACQEAIEDVVEFDAKVVSEEADSAVVELTVVPLDIVKVIEDAAANSLSEEFVELSEEEQTDVVVEQYLVALENAEAGVEKTIEVAMLKEGDYWVIQDVNTIQELNFVGLKFLTNVGTLPNWLAGEDAAAEESAE